jgi:N-acetylmuramoyl-L-alanine amidase
VAVGHTGSVPALAAALGRALVEAGALAAVLHHPNESVQAAEANDFRAEAFLGLGLLDGAGCRAAYYSTEAFESVGGRQLAHAVLDTLPVDLFGCPGEARGMRLPVLRETRMPAVVCELGPPRLVVEHGARLADALTDALASWWQAPLA